MKKQITIICMAALLLTGCAARPDETKSTAGVPQGMATAIAEAVHAALKPGEITELAEQPEAEALPSDEKKEQQTESVAEPVSEPKPEPERDTVPPAQAENKPSEAASTQTETPVSISQDFPAPVQPEPQPIPDPQPQPPARPAFDAGTVISMACSQIGGMTRVNGAEQGMGSFTHSFGIHETQESIAAGLAAILAQERDLYGNTYYDIVYCGESGGYHTFRCYRA